MNILLKNQLMYCPRHKVCLWIVSRKLGLWFSSKHQFAGQVLKLQKEAEMAGKGEFVLQILLVLCEAVNRSEIPTHSDWKKHISCDCIQEYCIRRSVECAECNEYKN